MQDNRSKFILIANTDSFSFYAADLACVLSGNLRNKSETDKKRKSFCIATCACSSQNRNRKYEEDRKKQIHISNAAAL